MLPMVKVPLNVESVMPVTVITSLATNVWPVSPEMVTEFVALTAPLAPAVAWLIEHVIVLGKKRAKPEMVLSRDGLSSKVTCPDVTTA